jgi:hypothetical protein
MLAPRSINNSSADQEWLVGFDADMVEMTLLLAASQAAALERAAHQCDLTVAQLTRRLIENFLSQTSILSPADRDYT